MSPLFLLLFEYLYLSFQGKLNINILKFENLFYRNININKILIKVQVKEYFKQFLGELFIPICFV